MNVFAAVIAFVASAYFVPQLFDGWEIVWAFPIVFLIVWGFIVGNFEKRPHWFS